MEVGWLVHRIPSSRSAAIAASVESGLRLSDGRRQLRQLADARYRKFVGWRLLPARRGQMRLAHSHTLAARHSQPLLLLLVAIQPTKPIAASQVVIKNFSCQLLSSFHVLSPVLWSQEEQACNQHATQEQCVCQANQPASQSP